MAPLRWTSSNKRKQTTPTTTTITTTTNRHVQRKQTIQHQRKQTKNKQNSGFR